MYIFITLSLISLALVCTAVWLAILDSRKKRMKNGFSTRGIEVKPSPKTSFLTGKLVGKWIGETVAVWRSSQGWKEDEIYKAIANVNIVIYDQHFVLALSGDSKRLRKAGAWALREPRTILMASLAGEGEGKRRMKKRLRYFVRHEISHFIVWGMTDISEEEGHHNLFKIVRLEV